MCFLVKGVIYSLGYLIANAQTQMFSSCSSAEMDGSISDESAPSF